MRTFAVVLLCFVVAVSAWPNKRTLDAEIRELSDHLLVDMLEARAGTHSGGPGGASKPDRSCQDGDEDMSFEVPEGCTTGCHTCTLECVDINESGESGEYEYRPSTNNPDICHRDRPEKPDHDHSCEAGEEASFPPGCEDTNADICFTLECVDINESGEYEYRPSTNNPDICHRAGREALQRVANLNGPCGQKTVFPPGCGQKCLAHCEDGADGNGKWSLNVDDLPAGFCPAQAAVKKNDHSIDESRLEEMLRNLKRMMEDE